MKNKNTTFKSVLVTCAIALGYAGLFIASSSVQPITRTQYASTTKKSDSMQLTYQIPYFEMANETKQLVTKGSITVSMEIQNFETNRLNKQTEKIAPSDNAEFDKYEVRNEPYYDTSPNQVHFRMRIKNNSTRILKLREVALVFQVDGHQVSLNNEYTTKWLENMVIPSSEEDYDIPGPLLSTLKGNSTVGVFLYDVPISYDNAGNVLKKENFEWYFYQKERSETKKEVITYTYRTEPVYKEVCSQCNGVGYFVSTKTCTTCGGKGYTTDSKGKSYKCFTCGGGGKISVKTDCSNCTEGKIAHRKSSNPTIDQQWTGWYVSVVTTPAGARVSTYNSVSQTYEVVGNSPLKIAWVNPRGTQYPILIESGSASIKVMPYTKSNKQSPKVQVDFTSGSPIAKIGNVSN